MIKPIITERLKILPANYGIGHIAMHIRWLNDPEVVRYSEQRHVKHTVDSQYKYAMSFNGTANEHCEIYVDGTPIGSMTAYIDRHNSVADMGIMIGEKRYWGKGYGKEAWETFMQYLLSNGIRKVEAGCMGANFPMIKICRDSGMIEEGRRRNHFQIGSELSDMVYFGTE